MRESICGIDCTACQWNGSCNGCAETGGQPFGVGCMVADCCKKGKTALDELKEKLLRAFRSLGIPDLQELTDLHPLKGSFINLAYRLPNGHTVRFWDDNKIYLGNQLHKKGSGRCYGIAADEAYLMVCEYGAGGSDPELIVFRRWNETLLPDALSETGEAG